MLGTDLTTLPGVDREILTNDQLIAIDQDPLGLQGTPDRRESTAEVWSRRLHDGAAAVALLNRGHDRREIHTLADEVDAVEADRYRVVDCWRDEVWETTGDLAASVDPRDTALFRLTPV